MEDITTANKGNKKNDQNAQKIKVQLRIKELEQEQEKLLKNLCDFYVFLLKKRADLYELEQEKERMTKLPPYLLFDYIKRLIFQILTENEELKIEIDKATKTNNMFRSIEEDIGTTPETEQDFIYILKSQILKMKEDNTRLKSEIETTVANFLELKEQFKRDVIVLSNEDMK